MNTKNQSIISHERNVIAHFGSVANYAQAIRETIDWCIRQGIAFVPVAPYQDPRESTETNILYKTFGKGTPKYHCPLDENLNPLPLITGKNPSHLTPDNKTVIINHKPYHRDRLPTQAEIEKWTANPLNGIGALGGWEDIVWIDFDRKNFETDDACENAASTVFTRIGELTERQPYYDKTHSGGFRIGVKVRNAPTFTLFKLEGTETHVGECLFTGKFTVLSPTIGISGNKYENLVLPDELPEVESLESIGIVQFSSSNSVSDSTYTFDPTPYQEVISTSVESIRLEDLINDVCKSYLNHPIQEGLRSDLLPNLYKEACGWLNWSLSQPSGNRIQINGSPEELLYRAGELCNVDKRRANSMVSKINPSSCTNSAVFYDKTNTGIDCWKKIRDVNYEVFQAKAPDNIKNLLPKKNQEQFKTSNGKVHAEVATPVIGIPMPEKTIVNEAVAVAEKVAINGSTTARVNTPVQERQKVVAGKFGGGGNGGNNNGGSGGNNGDDEKSLHEKIKAIVETATSESNKKFQLSMLSAATKKAYKDISDIAWSIENEVFQEDAISRAKQTLLELKKDEQHIDVEQLLGSYFGGLVIEQASFVPTAPSYILTTLLPIVASLLGTSCKLIINPANGFTVTPIIWAYIVAKPGAAKSPAQSVVLKPLKKIQKEYRERYKQELKQWEKQHRVYLSNLKNDPDAEEPEKPKRRMFCLSDVNTETLEAIHEDNPRGLLLHRDEAIGAMKSRNMYRNGLGADEEKETEQFNGYGTSVHRMTRSVELDETAVSRTGTLQEEVLADFLGDFSDKNGWASRNCFDSSEAPKRYYNRFHKHATCDFSEVAENLYRKLIDFEGGDFLLSAEADELFEIWQHTIVDQEVKAMGAENAILAKGQTYCLRFALIFHIIRAILEDKQPEPTISAATFKLGISLANFYIYQHKKLHTHHSPEHQNAGLIQKIYRTALSHGCVTAALLQQRTTTAFKKMKSTMIYPLLKAAQEIYGGVIKGFGRGMKYYLDPNHEDLKDPDPKPPIDPNPPTGGNDNDNNSTPPNSSGDSPTQPNNPNEPSSPTSQANLSRNDVDTETTQVREQPIQLVSNLDETRNAETFTKQAIQAQVGEVGKVGCTNFTQVPQTTEVEYYAPISIEIADEEDELLSEPTDAGTATEGVTVSPEPQQADLTDTDLELDVWEDTEPINIDVTEDVVSTSEETASKTSNITKQQSGKGFNVTNNDTNLDDIATKEVDFSCSTLSSSTTNEVLKNNLNSINPVLSSIKTITKKMGKFVEILNFPDDPVVNTIQNLHNYLESPASELETVDMPLEEIKRLYPAPEQFPTVIDASRLYTVVKHRSHGVSEIHRNVRFSSSLVNDTMRWFVFLHGCSEDVLGIHWSLTIKDGNYGWFYPQL